MRREQHLAVQRADPGRRRGAPAAAAHENRGEPGRRAKDVTRAEQAQGRGLPHHETSHEQPVQEHAPEGLVRRQQGGEIDLSD